MLWKLWGSPDLRTFPGSFGNLRFAEELTRLKLPQLLPVTPLVIAWKSTRHLAASRRCWVPDGLLCLCVPSQLGLRLGPRAGSLKTRTRPSSGCSNVFTSCLFALFPQISPKRPREAWLQFAIDFSSNLSREPGQVANKLIMEEQHARSSARKFEQMPVRQCSGSEPAAEPNSAVQQKRRAPATGPARQPA